MPLKKDVSGRRMLQIDARRGTSGVGLARDPDGAQLRLVHGSDAFYGCRTEIVGQEVVGLFARTREEATPGGCDDVVLLPQCEGEFGDGAEHPFAQAAECFPGGL